MSSSVRALRPLNAGSEESLTPGELEELFRPAVVHSEWAAEKGIATLERTMKEYLKARDEGQVGAAFIFAVEIFLKYDGVALYLVDPPQKWDQPYRVRSEFRNDGFLSGTGAPTLTEARFEKDWALRFPSSEGDRWIEDRWEELEGPNAHWIDRNALMKDAELYNRNGDGKEKVRSVYYVVLRNRGIPWGLVLLQNWTRGSPLFQGKTDAERETHRRRVRQMVETLGNGALFALENVRLYQQSPVYQELWKKAQGIIAGPLHDLKNSIARVSATAQLLDFLPPQYHNISVLGREIDQLSMRLADEATQTLREIQGKNSADSGIWETQPAPAELSQEALARYGELLHQLAVDLWDPVLSGEAERLRQEVIRKYEQEVLRRAGFADLTRKEFENHKEAPDSPRQKSKEEVQAVFSVLDGWETLGTQAIISREDLKGQREAFAGQLRELLERVKQFDSLQQKLAEMMAGKTLDEESRRDVQKVINRIDGLREDMQRFVTGFGEKIGIQSRQLVIQGDRDLAKELAEAVESSVAWINGKARYDGLQARGGVIRGPFLVEHETAAVVRDALSELLYNAWKYKGERGNKFRVQVTAEYDPQQGLLIVSVSDNGVGIPRDKQHLLFQMGERIERPEIEGTQGTGYGLAPIKAKLQALGKGDQKGDIKLVWSRSDRDRKKGERSPLGSEFRFRLPVKPLSAPELAPVAAGAEENKELRWGSWSPISVQVRDFPKADWDTLIESVDRLLRGTTSLERSLERSELSDTQLYGIPLMMSALKKQSKGNLHLAVERISLALDWAATLKEKLYPDKKNVMDADDLFHELLWKGVPLAGEAASFNGDFLENLNSLAKFLLKLRDEIPEDRQGNFSSTVTPILSYYAAFPESSKAGTPGEFSEDLKVLETATLSDWNLDRIPPDEFVKTVWRLKRRIPAAGAEEKQERRLLGALLLEISKRAPRIAALLNEDEGTLAALRKVSSPNTASVNRIFQKVPSLKSLQKGEAAGVAGAVEYFQKTLDPQNPRFSIQAWARALHTGELVIGEEDEAETSGRDFLNWVDLYIRAIEPNFRLTDPPEESDAPASAAQIWAYNQDLLEQVFFRRRIMVFGSRKNPGEVVVADLTPLPVRTTPAGRQVPVYLAEPARGEEVERIRVGGATANYILFFKSGRELDRNRFYAPGRRRWLEWGRRLWGRARESNFNFPDPNNWEQVKLFFWRTLSAWSLGRYSESEFDHFYTEDFLPEELAHSDTRAFGDALMGHRRWRDNPEETVTVVKKILREGGVLRRNLDAIQTRPMEEQFQEAQAILEVEGWLATLRDSPEPAYKFLAILRPDAMTGSHNVRAAELLLQMLRETLFAGLPNEAEGWGLLMREAALRYGDFSQRLRIFAHLILDREFLPHEQRIAPRPWRPTAAGAEEKTRVEETLRVPVADQLVVGTLAHSPGIRELQASLKDSGVQVKEVKNPRESAELLRAELVGLLILAPEDSETGDWRGGTAVPTVVLPAFVAAGLTEREMAALAAEARVRGRILYINDITREGAEGQILVLRMA